MTFIPRKSYLRRRRKPHFGSLLSLPSGAMTPAMAVLAYGCPKVTPVRKVRIGIVSLGGFFDAAALQAAFSPAGYNQPIPSVTTSGQQDITDKDSTVENMLDIEVAPSACTAVTGQSTDVYVSFQPNAAGSIAAGIKDCADSDCELISISWGAPLSQTDPQEIAATSAAILYAQAKGCHVLCATGDNSLNDGTNSRTPDHPSCDENAWGVGGTTLRLTASGSIASEAAWGDGNSADEGGGGGFVPGSSQPPWQQGKVPNGLRGKPDSSANADPATGYAIVANGSWQVVGGTSASTPLTAGILAGFLSSLPGRVTGTQLQTLLYAAATTAWNDITLGSNGDAAVSGWDDSTGLGSPNGPGLLASLSGVAPPVQPPAPPPVSPPPPSSGAVTLPMVLAAVNKAFAADERLYGFAVRRILEHVRADVQADVADVFRSVGACVENPHPMSIGEVRALMMGSKR